ncbi:MAG: hypothetical protein ACRCY4_01170 [Brevinema sp.]
MKVLIIISLLLTTCAKQPAVEAQSDIEAVNLEEAVRKQLPQNEAVEEVVKDLQERQYVTQGFDSVPIYYGVNIRDELMAIRKEKINETDELVARLIRVQDSLNFYADITVYNEFLWDPIDEQYYAALFIPEQEIVPKDRDWLRDTNFMNQYNNKPLTWISNTMDGQQIFKDSETGYIFYRRLVTIPDLYKGSIDGKEYLYDDPSNQIKASFQVKTNINSQNYMTIYYTATHPISGRMMYAGRVPYANINFERSFREIGALNKFYYNEKDLLDNYDASRFGGD